MKSFATYIEYVLMTQHYVFVPQIGGFMLKVVSAQIIPSSRPHANGFKLIPPHREIQFNRFMTHDDGLLINAYMEANGLTYDEAQGCVMHETNLILKQLEQHKEVSLGNLGTLSYDKDCHISFAAKPGKTNDASLFGFSEIVIKDTQSREQSQNKDTIIIPIRRKWLQQVAVIALIICSLFASFHPFSSRNNTSENYASVMTHDILNGQREPNYRLSHDYEDAWANELSLLNDEAMADSLLTVAMQDSYFATEVEANAFAPSQTTELTANAFASSHDSDGSRAQQQASSTMQQQASSTMQHQASSTMQTSSAQQASASSAAMHQQASAQAASSQEKVSSQEKSSTQEKASWVETQTVANAQLYQKDAPTSINGKVYYIIVASCTSQEEANKKLNKLLNMGYTEIGILIRDGRYRLYIDAFALKDDANTYLKQIRMQESFHDAWLLPVRLNDLSLISKNKHNEQLPMELSHLTTRTDSNQGIPDSRT